MLKILSRRIQDNTTFNLLKEIIFSYAAITNKRIGMPIGNLTSQIFANIYLNELDRFIKHTLKPKAYVRYGDDFLIIEIDLAKLKFLRNETIAFLEKQLRLKINPKSDKIVKFRHGLKYLGVKLWPSGRTLNKRSLSRAENRLNTKNISSYSGLIKKHTKTKLIKKFNWLIYEKIIEAVDNQRN